MSLLRSTSAATRRPLRGRSRELALLTEVVERGLDGVGQVALVEGEAGIGKSRVLAEALDHATQRGYHVLLGGADELEQTRPFGGLVQALGLDPKAEDPRRAEIGRLLAGDHAAAPGGSYTRVPDLAFRIVDAILGLLEELATHRPLLLALEDLHWADPSTLRSVGVLGRRLSQLPLTLLCTFRPTPRSPQLDRVIDILLSDGGQLLMLGAVDDEALSRLVADVAGAPPGPKLLAKVAGTGGNPLFVIELVSALRDEGVLEVSGGQAETTQAGVPPTLRLTILRRLSILPDDTLEVLRIASLLGRSFSVADLATVSERSALQLLAALEPALAAGLLVEAGDELAFRHDLVRNAIYQDLPLALRKGLHRQAGRALAHSGTPARDVATQLSLGAYPGDTEAVGWLRQAARDAALRSPALAVDLLERARELLPAHSGEHDQVVAELAPLLIQTGRGAEVVALVREVLRTAPQPAVEVALRRALGEVLWTQNRLEAAATELEAAAGVAGGPPTERVGALALAANVRFFQGQLEAAQTQAERAQTESQRIGDELGGCLALQTLALVAAARGHPTRAAELAEQAVRLAHQVHHPRGGYLYPHFYLGLALLDADRLDEAEAALQEGRRLAEQRGTTLWLPLYHFALALQRLFGGAWDDGLAEADAGLLLADEVGTRLHAPFLHGLGAWVAIQRGDLAVAEARLQAASQEFLAAAHESWVAAEAEEGVGAAGPCWPVEYGMWVQGLLAEAKGDQDAALWALEQAWGLAAPVRYFLSSRMFGPDLVRVALHAGQRQEAEAAAQEVEEGARRVPVPTARGAALLCRGLVDDDPEVLLAAVEAYRQGPRPVETAFACEAAGAALGRAGRTSDAIALLEEALATYERVGATPAVARIQALLRTLGVRRRRAASPRGAKTGWDSLTDSELQVVRLVGEGLTNRQVGERLYISRRTVETHLAHVFQKLGLTGRAQLAAEAARHS